MESELDHTKKLALAIKERIETASSEERFQILEDLHKKWIITPDRRNNMFDYLRFALHNFGVEEENLQIGAFERAKKVVIYQLNYLHLHFMKEEVDDEVQKEMYQEQFNKLFKAIIDADNAIQFSLYLKSSMTLEEIGKETKLTKQDLFRFSEVDYEKLSPYQSLILYILECLQRKEYRRYVIDGKGSCYQKIYNEEGYDTHAWKPAMSIKEFILDSTRKDYNFQMWSNLTASKDNLKATTNYLTEMLGGEFEDLVRDRHIFSFKNGIYITNKISKETSMITDQWIPFVGPKSRKVGASIVSCKLFDLEFEDCETTGTNRKYGDWFDIVKLNAPNFIHVMEYQHWPEDVQKWMCILIGRMLYDIKEHDDWQVLPYLLGQAGTGKSTILDNVVRQLYESADVGVLSNNVEKKFGLSAIVGKKIFIGPEIKENFSLEQTELQSMISGEMVQVNVKFKQAHSQRFKAAGMLAGNVLPGFSDNAGSMSRRLIVFPFNYKVKKGEGDGKLGEKIQKEIAYIIQACNKGYLNAVEEHGSKGIWDVLPEFFKETKKQLSEDSNALTNFLSSSLVTLASKTGESTNMVYTREKVFVAAFMDHCRENHLGNNKWTSQYYLGPFSDFGIEVNKNARRKYPRDALGGASVGVYTGTFFFGVDLQADVAKKLNDADSDSDNGFSGL